MDALLCTETSLLNYFLSFYPKMSIVLTRRTDVGSQRFQLAYFASWLLSFDVFLVRLWRMDTITNYVNCANQPIHKYHVR